MRGGRGVPEQAEQIGGYQQSSVLDEQVAEHLATGDVVREDKGISAPHDESDPGGCEDSRWAQATDLHVVAGGESKFGGIGVVRGAALRAVIGISLYIGGR